MNESYDKMSVGQWSLKLVHGSFIGVGSILPGVSGSVFSVLFGIYQPMMALLAHPIRAFKTYYKLFIPVGIGFLLGFFGLAKLLSMLFETAETLATCVFVGLIAGMIPSVIKDAGKQGRSKGSWVAFAIGFALLFAFFMLLESGNVEDATEITVAENYWRTFSPWWYFFCGAVWGLTFVLPGLSSSSILLFLGLYKPMTAGISGLDLWVVLPLFAGIVLTALVFARPVNWLLGKHYSILFHVILGVVIASTAALALSLLPMFKGITEVIFGIVLILVGIVAAVILDRFNNRIMHRAEG